MTFAQVLGKFLMCCGGVKGWGIQSLIDGSMETTLTANAVTAEWNNGGLSGILDNISGALVLSDMQYSLSLTGYC